MSKSTKLFTLFIIASLILSVQIVYAPVGDPDVVVPRLLNPVTLDGDVSNDEWSDAIEVSTYFHFYERDEPYEYLGNRSGSLYFKHDCVNLYIGAVIVDPTENITLWSDPSGEPEATGDCLWVFYDVNKDFSQGPGDDEKGIAHPNFTVDGALIPDPPGWSFDEDLGGNKDIEGYSMWSSGFIMYELVHPLNSHDHYGNDPAIGPGGMITTYIIVQDPDLGTGWGSGYDLIITECPAVGGVLTSTFSPLLASFYITVLILALIMHKGIRGKPAR
jgi:hypothetical protein